MTSSLKLFLILYYIKQIDSKLPCVCSVIDYRGRQVSLNLLLHPCSVVNYIISDTLGCALCASFLFLPHFDVICDLLLNRRTAIWNPFVK